jgi:hypothetical protein
LFPVFLLDVTFTKMTGTGREPTASASSSFSRSKNEIATETRKRYPAALLTSETLIIPHKRKQTFLQILVTDKTHYYFANAFNPLNLTEACSSS